MSAEQSNSASPRPHAPETRSAADQQQVVERGRRKQHRGRRGRGRGGRQGGISRDRPDTNTPGDDLVKQDISITTTSTSTVTTSSATQFCSTMPALPLRIIKMIFSFAAFDDANLHELSRRPLMGRCAFPFLVTLGSVNSWARAHTTELLEEVVVIHSIPEAEAFIHGSDKGASARHARVIVIDAILNELSAFVLEDVLRAATNVEQLVISTLAGHSVGAEMFELESLSNLKALFLSVMTHDTCRVCRTPSPGHTQRSRSLKLHFVLDRLYLEGVWDRSILDSALYAALLANTRNSIEVTVHPGQSALTRAQDISPIFPSGSFKQRSMPVQQLSIRPHGSDNSTIASLAPFLIKCRNLRSINTTVTGLELGVLLDHLPVKAPLKTLELTVGEHDECHRVKYDYDNVLTLLRTRRLLSSLKKLSLPSCGPESDKRGIIASCKIRKIELVWNEVAPHEFEAPLTFPHQCLCSSCALERRIAAGPPPIAVESGSSSIAKPQSASSAADDGNVDQPTVISSASTPPAQEQRNGSEIAGEHEKERSAGVGSSQRSDKDDVQSSGDSTTGGVDRSSQDELALGAQHDDSDGAGSIEEQEAAYDEMS